MATNNVPNVNASVLNSTSVKTAQENLEEERREAERLKYRRELQRDSVTVVKNAKLGVAGAAEPAKPVAKTTPPHERIKAAYTVLNKALVAAGGKGGQENLDGAATDKLETIQNEIDALIERGAPKGQIEKLEAKRDALFGAREEYRAALADAADVEGPAAAGEAQTVSIASEAGASGGDSQPMAQEEKELWSALDAQLETVGFRRDGEKNVDEIQKKFMLRIGSEVAKLHDRKKALTVRFTEVHNQWKSTKDPKVKAECERVMQEIKMQAAPIDKEILRLQKAVTDVVAASDAVLSYQVTKELGLNAAPTRPATKSAKVKSASASQTGSSSTGESKTQKGGSQAGLTVQSATEGGSAFGPQGGPQGQDQGPLLGTASASEGDSYVSPDVALARTAATDLTGTTMAIASQGRSQRGEFKRLDKFIKKLILAAQSGNMEAVVSGLLFLGKRQNILTTSMGAQTLIAMQQYEKQLGVISNQIGALKPSPTYASQLAKLNADMNIYSSSRQMITQTFRDFLNAKEQVEELGHSVIGKLGQLGSRLASFQ